MQCAILWLISMSRLYIWQWCPLYYSMCPSPLVELVNLALSHSRDKWSPQDVITTMHACTLLLAALLYYLISRTQVDLVVTLTYTFFKYFKNYAIHWTKRYLYHGSLIQGKPLAIYLTPFTRHVSLHNYRNTNYCWRLPTLLPQLLYPHIVWFQCTTWYAILKRLDKTETQWPESSLSMAPTNMLYLNLCMHLSYATVPTTLHPLSRLYTYNLQLSLLG